MVQFFGMTDASWYHVDFKKTFYKNIIVNLTLKRKEELEV
jgi:hypothetical protein